MPVDPSQVSLLTDLGMMGMLAVALLYFRNENQELKKENRELRDAEADRLRADMELFRTAVMKAHGDVQS